MDPDQVFDPEDVPNTTTKFLVEVSSDMGMYGWGEFGTFSDAHTAREVAYRIKCFFSTDARVSEVTQSNRVIYYT